MWFLCVQKFSLRVNVSNLISKLQFYLQTTKKAENKFDFLKTSLLLDMFLSKQ